VRITTIPKGLYPWAVDRFRRPARGVGPAAVRLRRLEGAIVTTPVAKLEPATGKHSIRGVASRVWDLLGRVQGELVVTNAMRIDAMVRFCPQIIVGDGISSPRPLMKIGRPSDRVQGGVACLDGRGRC